LCVRVGVYDSLYRDKKVVGVFCAFSCCAASRTSLAPLQGLHIDPAFQIVRKTQLLVYVEPFIQHGIYSGSPAYSIDFQPCEEAKRWSLYVNQRSMAGSVSHLNCRQLNDASFLTIVNLIVCSPCELVEERPRHRSWPRTIMAETD
jgi:hypothetical protein